MKYKVGQATLPVSIRAGAQRSQSPVIAKGRAVMFYVAMFGNRHKAKIAPISEDAVVRMRGAAGEFFG